MVEGETTAPSPLQEADLISLMEKHGIGKYACLRSVVVITMSGLKVFCSCHIHSSLHTPKSILTCRMTVVVPSHTIGFY